MEYLENNSVPEYLTMDEIAERLGVSYETVTRRVKALGLSPVSASKGLGGGLGKTAALYDLNAFNNLQQQQQQTQIVEKQRSAGRKAAEGMKLAGRQEFVKITFDELTLDEKVKFSLESIVATLQTLDNNRIALEQEIKQKDERILKLEKEVDHRKDWGTLEKFNERYHWGKTAHELSAISRRMGKAGFEREQIYSIEHPNGVWTYKVKVEMKDWLQQEYNLILPDSFESK